jgi:hypothetical protein
MPLLFSPVFSPTHNCSLFFLFRVRVGRCPSPTLRWSVPHDSCCYKPSPLQAHWGRWHHSCLLWLACLFTVREGAPLPHSQDLRAPCNLCYVSLFFSAACLSFRFFSFFPGGVSVFPGGCADLSQGVPHASYLLTKQDKSWRLAAREPSWFLHLTWWGDAVCGLGVWRWWSFASSWWFFLPGVSPASLQEFTLGSTLSASSLYSPSGNLLYNVS